MVEPKDGAKSFARSLEDRGSVGGCKELDYDVQRILVEAKQCLNVLRQLGRTEIWRSNFQALQKGWKSPGSGLSHASAAPAHVVVWYLLERWASRRHARGGFCDTFCPGMKLRGFLSASRKHAIIFSAASHQNRSYLMTICRQTTSDIFSFFNKGAAAAK